LLSFLHERLNATGVAVDRSAAALGYARANADRLGLGARVRWIGNSWAAVEGVFDLVLANPPYVAPADMDGLQPELRHEPREALVGGEDGLDAYRSLAPVLQRTLAPPGRAVVEIGAGQDVPVRDIFTAAGLLVLSVCPDLAGIPRAIVAAKA
jgi:release factor glutamine methyltransferase